MTTETRTDRPQIDTSRMNIEQWSQWSAFRETRFRSGPPTLTRQSGHRNDRPSQRRHPSWDPAIVLIGLPWDDINEPDPESENEPDPESENEPDPESENEPDPESENEPEPESENEPDPEIAENENEPDISGYENTNQPAKARTCPNQASPMLTRRPITKTLSRFSISTKSLSIATDMTEFDTLDWPRLQLHDAGSLVYAYTDIPSMAWSAMRTPRSTTATTPWRRIASIR